MTKKPKFDPWGTPLIPAVDYRKYLDPRVLARVGALELRARMIVEGYYTGKHRSPYRGLSVEFAAHRVYSQGDDVKHIDWKVYGRTNKFYIKEYEQETNLNLVLAVDCSESMAYASPSAPMSKHDYAVSVAASLAYLALQQQDSVGLALFNDALTGFIRPSNAPGHWRTLIRELAGRTGPAKTSIRRVLEELADRLQRRSLIVIISDLFDDADQILRGIRRLKYSHHDVVAYCIMDRLETDLTLGGPTLFEGLEQAGKLFAEPRSLRARYNEEVQRFTDRLRIGCRKMNVDFNRFITSERLDNAISTALATRAASIRKRAAKISGGA